MPHDYAAQRRETFQTFRMSKGVSLPKTAVVEYAFFIEELDASWPAFERALRQAGFRTRTRMNVDRVPVGDGEALRSQRFQSDVVGAAGDGALDLGVEELLERREEDALEFDRQGEQAVEERRDRRQLVLDAI